MQAPITPPPQITTRMASPDKRATAEPSWQFAISSNAITVERTHVLLRCFYGLITKVQGLDIGPK